MPSRRPRPPIWTEGRQSPPFALRAFLRASTALGRQMAGGLMGRLTPPLGRLASDLYSGRRRIPPHRLGRLGRVLPSAASVGGVLAGLNGVLSHATVRLGPVPSDPGDGTVLPVPPWPPEGLGRRQRQAPAAEDAIAMQPVPVARPAAQPARASAASAHEDAEDDTLAAIRSLIGAHQGAPVPARATVTRPIRPIRPGQAGKPGDPPAECPAPPTAGADRPAGPGLRLAGGAVAAMALLAAFPAGMARAGWLWAQGRDLRDPETYG